LEALDTGATPALIITDIQMPDIDGWQLCKLLRSARYRHVNVVPIIAVSAIFSGNEPTKALANLDVAAFITMPLSAKVLCATVRKVLSGSVVSSLFSTVACCGFSAQSVRDLQHQLSSLGYEVEILEYAHLLAQWPNLHNLEIVLLGGALEQQCSTIELLRTNGFEHHIIAASSNPVHIAQCLESGADRWLYEPIDRAALAALIKLIKKESASRHLENILQKRTAQLEESRRWFELLMESMPEPVCIISPTYHFEYCNKSALELIGEFDKNALCHEVFCNHPDPCPECPLHLLKTQPRMRFQMHATRLERFFSVSASKLSYDNSTDSFLLVLSDITEEIRLKNLLKQAEKMEALGQLAGGIAHDFNNILGAVLGHCELLELEMNVNKSKIQIPALLSRVSTIRSAAQRAAQLVGQLLAFSRQGKYTSVQVDMHKIIDEAILLLERTIDKSIQISTHFEASCFGVRGDASQLHNVIINLAINARDAMEHGGELSFTTANTVLDADDASARALKAGAFLQILVKDSGCGIDASNLEKIFNPFFTTKSPDKGTGLGLASVYGIVKNHQGQIQVKSSSAKGSEFEILFPCEHINQTSEPPPAAQKKIKKHKTKHSTQAHQPTVLVADDEPMVREAIMDVLSMSGYHVEGCSSGEEALERYRLGQHYDAVLLDMIMPGMGGLECLKQLLESAPHQPIIMVTGYSDDKSIEEALRRGACALITKPFTKDKLLGTVAAVLKKQALSS
jgi:signal transduction histidine kinase/DNA-binding response OmpR family regulator